MAKMALCITRQDLVDLNRILRYPELKGMLLAEAPEEFLRLATSLQDRATCETDSSLLQLLPYVLIQREDTGQYFMYCRGKGGAEARLHGNLSVGVGGHVDTDVEDNQGLFDLVADDLLILLENTAMREVNEEVGIKFLSEDSDEDDESLNDSMAEPTDMWTGTLIYDDTNPVGQVHLGLLFTLVIPDASLLGDTEVGIIEGSQWITAKELMAPEVFDRLENWSKIVVQALATLDDEADSEEESIDESELFTMNSTKSV